MQREPATLKKSSTDEDFDAYNHLVEVALAIPRKDEGRIHLRSTIWRARNHDGERRLAQVDGARLIFRKN